jgi:hypothetical protein
MVDEVEWWGGRASMAAVRQPKENLIGQKNRSLGLMANKRRGLYRWMPLLPVLSFLIFFFVIPLSRGLYGSLWDPNFTIGFTLSN